MIDRKILGYMSFVLIMTFLYALVVAEQYITASIITVVYVGLIFGIDKFKIDLKNKKVELEDENRDS